MPAIGSITRAPSQTISPPSTGSRPSMQRSSVVLPQPDGPTMVTISRSPTSKSTPLNTSSVPKRLTSERTRMRAGAFASSAAP